VGILNSDGDEKSKRGDSNESKHDSSWGESDHRGSGEEGELVNDGIGDELDGRSKLKKSSHEVEYGSFSVLPGVVRGGSTHVLGCSKNSGCLSASGSAKSGIGD